MFKHSHILTAAALMVMVATQPISLRADPSNLGPPIGPILDLAGQAIPTSYTNYTVAFIAGTANTDLLFALRHDPGYFSLDDISMADASDPSHTNLVVNGDFETGDLTGWTDENIYGAAFAGTVGDCQTGPAHSGISSWCDGSVQAYDAIDQHIPTTVGDTYIVSFWLTQAGNQLVDTFNFQPLSTNGDVDFTGGNAMDVLVYAQAELPAPSGSAAEPVSMLLFGSGLAGIGLLSRRRAEKI